MNATPRPAPTFPTTEHARLAEANTGGRPWRRFGPYLAERQWGTVREDDSPDGTAWDYVHHDHARSRAYRWGEDGLAGFSVDRQLLCLGLGLWNTVDPILKGRLFGLAGPEGNHGEDVKERYRYLDTTPSHAFQRMTDSDPLARCPYEEHDGRAAVRHPELGAFDGTAEAPDRLAFYDVVHGNVDDPDARSVQRQAFDWMLWSKPVHTFDVARWPAGDPGQPAPPAGLRHGRNADWGHLNNADVISLPDTWAYPRYAAAWDLAFHAVPLTQVDSAFAKEHLLLLTREWFRHRNGRSPAYENRQDAHGLNLFQGGFLELDNVGVFDRCAPLPVRSLVGLIPLEAVLPDRHGHSVFHEFVHGDTGRGLGAAHPTGWTGLIASLLATTAARPTSAEVRS